MYKHQQIKNAHITLGARLVHNVTRFFHSIYCYINKVYSTFSVRWARSHTFILESTSLNANASYFSRGEREIFLVQGVRNETDVVLSKHFFYYLGFYPFLEDEQKNTNASSCQA